MNISIDIDEFKKGVKTLRNRLDRCRESGVLDKGLKEEIDKFTEIEEKLLKDLIPYYRTLEDIGQKTSIEICKVEEIGDIRLEGFLKSKLKLDESLYIISSTKKEVRFLYINNMGDKKKSKLEIEWSKSIKGIDENISSMYRLENDIILCGIRGNYYRVSLDSYYNSLEKGLDIKAQRIEIREETKKGKGYLDKESLCLNSDITNYSYIERVKKDYFIVGTIDGYIYITKRDKNQLEVLDRIKVFNGEVKNIKLLDNEFKNIDDILIIGNNGNAKILSINDKDIKKNIKGLSGDLFDAESSKGTAIILSESGFLYLLEENFGIWQLSKDSIIDDYFFINIFKLDTLKYLALDLDGDVYSIYINRIITPDDLWSTALYT